VDFNRIPLQGKDGLLAHLARVPDRCDVHGQRHSQTFILVIVACAVLAGMREFRAAAQVAENLSPEALRRLGVRPRSSSGAFLPPSELTIRRTMQRIDIEAFERELGTFSRQIGRGGTRPSTARRCGTPANRSGNRGTSGGDTRDTGRAGATGSGREDQRDPRGAPFARTAGPEREADNGRRDARTRSSRALWSRRRERTTC